MAEAKKRPKHSNRKTSAEKKGKRKQKSPQDTALRNDILLIAAVGIAVLLMLSNFGLCGSFCIHKDAKKEGQGAIPRFLPDPRNPSGASV